MAIQTMFYQSLPYLLCTCLIESLHYYLFLFSSFYSFYSNYASSFVHSYLDFYLSVLKLINSSYLELSLSLLSLNESILEIHATFTSFSIVSSTYQVNLFINSFHFFVKLVLVIFSLSFFLVKSWIYCVFCLV